MSSHLPFPATARDNAMQCAQYTAIIFIAVSITAFILSIILPKGPITTQFTCFSSSGPTSTDHTLFIIYIPAFVSFIYTIWCLYAARNLSNPPPPTQTQQKFQLNTGVNITFMSSFLVIPVVYHSGVTCLPDLLAVFIIYASLALCWHVAHVNAVHTRYTLLLFALSVLKIATVILNIRTVQHVSGTTWVFLLIDGTTHLIHMFVKCIAQDNNNIQIIQFTAHCQLVLLIAIAIYAATCI